MTQAAVHLRAIVYALAGFTCWVVSDSLLKLIGNSAPKYELMAISSVGGMMIIFAFVSARREIGKLKPHKWRGLFILGALHLVNFSCWVMALTQLPLADLYTVTFLSPMMVAILAALFLREHFSWKHGLAIFAGFVGVTIAVNPEQLLKGSSDWTSYGFVFASMLIISVQMLILRILGRSETRECMAFYPRIVILAGTVAVGLFYGFTAIPAKSVVITLLSGAAGSIGWLLMAHAYKMAPAAIVAPFHYSEIVTGSIFGYLIWKDIPGWHVLAGAAIIIASGLYIITHTRKSARLLKEETHV